MDRPLRLQGTDGIRAVVGPDDEASQRDPLGTYLRTGRLTPAFSTLYARAFAEEEASPGEEVIVGWDLRDRGGDFTKAVVGASSKPVGRPVVLGTVPTPVVPLLMIRRECNAGIMVTASHNPASQNGLKLFLGPLATKLYPADEKRLTQKCTTWVEGWPVRPRKESLCSGRLRHGEPSSITPATRSIPGCPNPSQVGPAQSRGPWLSSCSWWTPRGKHGWFGRRCLPSLGSQRVIEVNGTGAPINEDGGVVELEQVHWVDANCRSDAARTSADTRVSPPCSKPPADVARSFCLESVGQRARFLTAKEIALFFCFTIRSTKGLRCWTATGPPSIWRGFCRTRTRMAGMGPRMSIR